MRIYHTKARRHEEDLRLRPKKATAVERRTGAKIPQYFPGAIKVDAASIHPKRLPSATATLRVFASSCEQIAGGADERRYCIAAGGEYAFALEKGRLYEVTISRDERVDFEWTDADGNGGCNRARSLDVSYRWSSFNGEAEILGAASWRAWLLDANGVARLMVEARNDCYCATGEVEVVRRFAGTGGAGEGATNYSESGAATFPNGNTGKDVAVVARGDAPIVVSAYYRHYPERKMRFNLMPVEMRTVTVFPCEVLDNGETPSVTQERIGQMLGKVNEIYRQVGLRFVATNVTTVTNKTWTENGPINRATGAAIRNHMSNTGGLGLYFVGGTSEDLFN